MAHFHAGFGLHDYTPTPKDHAFQIFDPISFRALILQEGDTNVTFLSGDVFSIETDLLDRVKKRLQHIDWLNRDHILPCASHIGTAPILSGPSADIGYLSPPEAHKEGGMEPQFAGLAIEAESLIRATACELASNIT